MATITRRDTHQWQAKCRRKGHVTQSKTFTSKADAQAWARDIESEIDRGVFVSRAEAERTTLGEALDRYAREVTPRKKGLIQELTRIKQWQAHPLAARYLSTIRGANFASYRDARRADGRAENTIRLDLALVSHVFEIARKEWGMESLANPVRNIQVPGGARQRDRRLHGDEERYLLAALDAVASPVMRSAVEFAIETAMRRSEILSLTWDAVSLESRVALLSVTKNGSSRAVPLSPKAIAVLRALPPPEVGDQVFALSPDRLSHLFPIACEAGRAAYLDDCKRLHRNPDKRFLQGLVFHDLRHEATSRFFERRLELMEVASITGHKTLTMLRRYTHLRAEDLAKKLA